MAEKIIDICTECGEETEVIIVDDETRLCEECLDFLDYVECDHCHEWWLADAVEFFEIENGNIICEHCKDMLDEEGI